jgi:hypothetical protein
MRHILFKHAIATLSLLVSVASHAEGSPQATTNASVWIGVDGVQSGLMNLPSLALVSKNDRGNNVASCFKNVKLVLKPNTPTIEFALIGAGGEISQDNCELPSIPE